MGALNIFLIILVLVAIATISSTLIACIKYEEVHQPSRSVALSAQPVPSGALLQKSTRSTNRVFRGRLYISGSIALSFLFLAVLFVAVIAIVNSNRNLKGEDLNHEEMSVPSTASPRGQDIVKPIIHLVMLVLTILLGLFIYYKYTPSKKLAAAEKILPEASNNNSKPVVEYPEFLKKGDLQKLPLDSPIDSIQFSFGLTKNDSPVLIARAELRKNFVTSVELQCVSHTIPNDRHLVMAADQSHVELHISLDGLPRILNEFLIFTVSYQTGNNEKVHIPNCTVHINIAFMK